MFIFLTARAIKRVLRVLENAKRVLQKPVREMHAPFERLGSKRNQYGDGLLRLVNV